MFSELMIRSEKWEIFDFFVQKNGKKLHYDLSEPSNVSMGTVHQTDAGVGGMAVYTGIFQ